jgi:hypothetical protein
MAEHTPAGSPAKDETSLTAYPEDEATLRSLVADGRVEAESFQRPVARCEISTCRGMCCYDGVYVSRESATIIEGAAKEHAEFFGDLGLRLPERVVVEGDWRWKKGGLKTAVVPRAFSKTVEGFPSHFNNTSCVFLTEDGRCSLQLLSIHQGRHPWYYKPVKCWMHPITLEGEEGAVLLLHSERTDPYRFPGYDGFVSRIFCGRTCPGGAPAAVVLEEELTFLSQIVGRDLKAEATGASASLMRPNGEAQT